MTVIGVAVGTPVGMLAGTYLAEYGKYSRLAFVVRFINDILLSAPSIVIGLFVYEIIVAPMGHFSAIAGAIALAVLVVPVVVRTTEDMLNLVPNPLREAGSALGMPRSMVIQRIGYRAVRAGLITGVLLAIARVSGETAPLLFTALNNQFFSTNLLTPDVELAGRDLSICAQPLQGLATVGLDRRSDHHAGRPGAQHCGPRPHRHSATEIVQEAFHHERRGRRAETCQAAKREQGQGPHSRSQFLLWADACAQGREPEPVRGPGDGVHRPVRLRQVDAAAGCSTACTTSIPASAPKAR